MSYDVEYRNNLWTQIFEDLDETYGGEISGKVAQAVADAYEVAFNAFILEEPSHVDPLKRLRLLGRL